MRGVLCSSTTFETTCAGTSVTCCATPDRMGRVMNLSVDVWFVGVLAIAGICLILRACGWR
jgi:hypothetical protein